MLFKASSLFGYEIDGTDGAVGTLDDLLFDDREWTIRWAVVDTGRWLPGRKVLLQPAALGVPDQAGGRFSVALSREQIEKSPDADLDMPVSRRHELELFAHYGWTPYWSEPVPGSSGLFAAGMPMGGADVLFPADMGRNAGELAPAEAAYAGAKPGAGGPGNGDPHLQSAKDITGYAIAATDGDIGEAEDFLVAEGSWAIRYAVVDTGRWLPGKKVLVSSRWIRDIVWGDRRIHVDLARAAVKDSPEFDPETAVDRDYEARLHQYYDQPIYWGF
jgi:hypothetical protein